MGRQGREAAATCPSCKGCEAVVACPRGRIPEAIWCKKTEGGNLGSDIINLTIIGGDLGQKRKIKKPDHGELYGEAAPGEPGPEATGSKGSPSH
jgi:hypothetical protein